MEIFNAKILELLVDNEKHMSEGLLPELVKRLILSSVKDISSIRIPSKDDIWAPGFDGFVVSEEQTPYVSKGQSIWEFGTNKDYLAKINEDYKKRSEDTKKDDKSCTTFYLVVPRLWQASESITAWENAHKGEWAKVHIIDASELCDWINSLPSVCCWLFENYYKAEILQFTSVSKAWEQFRQKTNPHLHEDVFLLGREKETDLLNKLDNKIIKVKSYCFIDALGFVLSAMVHEVNHKETFVVVENEETFIKINRFVKNQTFIALFHYEGDIKLENNNSVILCFNHEDRSIQPDIELTKLSKSNFEKALHQMGITDIEATRLAKFTDRNILALLRKIPGNSIIARPKWANDTDLTYLTPLLFLRKINRDNHIDQRLVELFGVPYQIFEKKINGLLKLEDAPIKAIDNYCAIIHYEELWNFLGLDISDSCYATLINVITSMLKVKNHKEILDLDAEILSSIDGRTFSNLITNLVYFSTISDSAKLKVAKDVKDILVEMSQVNCRDILINNLPLLANVAPSVIVLFIENNMKRGEGFIDSIFANQNYTHDYCKILWALEVLLQFDESKFRACGILKELYLRDYEYRISNCPKDTLMNGLFLFYSNNALALKDKQNLLLKFIEDDSKPMSLFALDLLNRNTYMRSVSLEVFKTDARNETITYGDLYGAINSIILKIIQAALETKCVKILCELIKSYRFVKLELLDKLINDLDPSQYEPIDLQNLYFETLLLIARLQKWRHNEENEEYTQYIAALTKLTDKIQSPDLLIRYSSFFQSWYECPLIDDSEEDDEIDYRIESEKKYKFRQDIYNRMKSEYGEDLLGKLLSVMSDDSVWGNFLLKIDEQIDKKILCDKCIELSKYHIALYVLNSIEVDKFTAIFKSYSNTIQLKLLQGIVRSDIYAILESEEEERAYWGGKTMYEYSTEAYKKLLKYNPTGLLQYYTFHEIKQENLNDVINVLKTIAGKDLDVRQIANENYHIHKIFSKIDALCYSEEIAQLELLFYKRKLIDNFLEGIKKYYFYNPSAIAEKLNNKEDFSSYLDFAYKFVLPEVAYEDYGKFEFFFDSVLSNTNDKNKAYGVCGQMLGRAIIGKDKIFPHEFVRCLIEKYSNDKLNNDFIIGKTNSIGLRTVGDGSDQKVIAQKLQEDANQIGIEYPQTAQLLRRLSDYHLGEARVDKLTTEIDLD